MMIVDETTKFKFSSFHKTKNGMMNPTCALINKLKKKDIRPKVIKCDDTDEKKSLEKVTNEKYWQMAK